MRVEDDCRFAGVGTGVCEWPSLVRLALAGLLALFGASMLPGRTEHLPRRIPGHAPGVFLNGYFFSLEDQTSRWLEPVAGRIGRVHLPEGDELVFASASPWRDERSRWQVVGRVSSFSGTGSDRYPIAHTLTRYEFPGGTVLDRVATECIPTSPPCWEPGTSARVVFAAGDGQLYRFDFESADPPGSTHCESVGRPEPLSWAVPQPGLGRLEAADPIWLAGGRLLVALRVLERDGGLLRHSSWQLWWLRLDRGGTEVVAAGPLVDPDRTIPASWDWGDRFPSLLVRPDGTLALAYLSYRPGAHLGQLHVASLRIDPATGDPSAEAGGPILAGDCLRTPPAPSADGRWVCCVVKPIGSGPRVIRLDVLEESRLPSDEISD